MPKTPNESSNLISQQSGGKKVVHQSLHGKVTIAAIAIVGLSW